jgi:hypothetical protein
MYTSKSGLYSGDLYLAKLDANGANLGFRDAGNTQALSFEAPQIEKVDKLSKRNSSYGSILDTVNKKNTQAVSFTLDDVFKENLAIAMFGEDAVVSQAAVAVVDEVVVARLDMWVPLVHSNLSTDVADAPTVKDSATGLITYVEDIDYEIDYERGMIKAITGGDITAAEALKVGYKTNGYTGFKVPANSVTHIDMTLLLIGKNRQTGEDVRVKIFKMTVNPSGVIDWLSDKFQELQFKADIIATDEGTWTVEVTTPTPAA